MFIFSHISSSLTFFYVCRTSNETVHEQTHALRAPRDIQLSTGKFEHFFSRIFYLKLCGFSFFLALMMEQMIYCYNILIYMTTTWLNNKRAFSNFSWITCRNFDLLIPYLVILLYRRQRIETRVCLWRIFSFQFNNPFKNLLL